MARRLAVLRNKDMRSLTLIQALLGNAIPGTEAGNQWHSSSALRAGYEYVSEDCDSPRLTLPDHHTIQGSLD